MDIASLAIKIDTAEARKAKEDLGGVKQSAGEAEGATHGLSKAFKLLGAAIVTYLSVRQIKRFASTAVREFAQIERMMYRMEAQAALVGHEWAQWEYLNEISRELGRSTLASASDVRQAASMILTAQDITQDSFERSLRISTDLSEIFGIALPSAARYMTRAIGDATGALSMFRRYGLQLEQGVLDQIQALQDAGRNTEAYGVLLDSLEGKIGGVADKAGVGLAGALDKLSESKQQLYETVGEQLAPAISLLVGDFADWVDAISDTVEAGDDLSEFMETGIVFATHLGNTVAWLVAQFGLLQANIERASLSLEEWGIRSRSFVRERVPFLAPVREPQSDRTLEDIRADRDALIRREIEFMDMLSGMRDPDEVRDRMRRELRGRRDRGTITPGAPPLIDMPGIPEDITERLAEVRQEYAALQFDLEHIGRDGWEKQIAQVENWKTAALAEWNEVREAAFEHMADIREDTDLARWVDEYSVLIDNLQEYRDTIEALSAEELRVIDAQREIEEIQILTAALADMEWHLMTREERIKHAYDERVRMVEDATKRMIITEERAAKLIADLHERKQEEMKDQADNTVDAWERAFDGWAASFSSTLNDMLWGAEVTFDSIARAFARMITQMIIQQQLIQPMASTAGGWVSTAVSAVVGGVAGRYGGSGGGDTSSTMAHGGIIHDGEVQPFARGGVVNRPTIFPLARGIGLMGEAGPEAILPLSRLPGGDLGVKAEGASVNIEIIDQRRGGEPVEARERMTPDGGREIEIVIRDVMQAEHAKGTMDKTMQQIYGIRRRGRA